MSVALGSVVGYLPVLACPAMMIFCMRGMLGGGKTAAKQAESQTLEARREALRQEMLLLDQQRLARGEITAEEYLRLHGAEAPAPQAPIYAPTAGLAAVPAKRRNRAG